MSAFLILPINIDGDYYCLTKGGSEYTIGRGNWRTQEIITGDISEGFGDDWITFSAGTLKFGLQCVSKITVSAGIDPPPGPGDSAAAEIFLNGVSEGIITIDSDNPSGTIEVILPSRPCGNVLQFSLSDEGISFGVVDVE
jgi:hypothetical protein